MPLARYAMTAWGTEIFVAPTWDRGEPWLSTLRHVAKEGRCFVLANDSDLVVLGVRGLLWEVSVEEGGLFGQCITQSNIVRPQMEVFSDPGSDCDFLRLLHGVDGDGCADATWWSQDADAVFERLRHFSCVAGNDYAKFGGIGPIRAKDIAIPLGARRTIGDVAQALAGATGSTLQEVSAALKTSMDMYCHPVVWNPQTGEHQHFSGVESSPDITANTGG